MPCDSGETPYRNLSLNWTYSPAAEMQATLFGQYRLDASNAPFIFILSISSTLVETQLTNGYERFAVTVVALATAACLSRTRKGTDSSSNGQSDTGAPQIKSKSSPVYRDAAQMSMCADIAVYLCVYVRAVTRLCTGVFLVTRYEFLFILISLRCARVTREAAGFYSMDKWANARCALCVLIQYRSIDQKWINAPEHSVSLRFVAMLMIVSARTRLCNDTCFV